jgi:hypothetical protein
MWNPRVTRIVYAGKQFAAVLKLGVDVEDRQVTALVKQVQLVAIGEKRAAA